MKSHLTTFLFLFFISINTVHAQVEKRLNNEILSSEAPTLRFEHLSLQDGMAQNSGDHIMQDSKGFIWISNQGGLHRYDGYEFKVYESIPFDTTSISDNWIRTSSESKSGDIWLTTEGGGLNRLNPETGKAIHYKHDPSDSTTISVNNPYLAFEDSKGDLWVSTLGSGLNKMKAGEDGVFIKYLNDPDDSTTISSNFIGKIEEDKYGNLWLGTGNGLNRINLETEKIKRYVYNPLVNEVGAPEYIIFDFYIEPGSEGIIWLATGMGVVRFNSETNESTRILAEPNSKSLLVNEFRNIQPDPNDPNVFWLSGRTGLSRFDSRTNEFDKYTNNPKDKHSLISNNIISMMLDNSGMMWLGTFNDGLNIFNPGAVNFNHIQHDEDNPESLAPGLVWGIYEDRNNSLWIGTFDGATGQHLTHFDGKSRKIRRYQHDPDDPSSLQTNNYWAFAEDDNGQFWIGGLGGLSKFDREAGRAERYDVPYGVFDLERDYNDPNLIWIGSTRGLQRLDIAKDEIQLIPLLGDTTQNEPPVLCLYSSPQHGLWVSGYEKGLYNVDNEMNVTLETYYDPKDNTKINNNSTQSILVRNVEPGILWLVGASSGSGLNKYNIETGEAKHFLKKDGLPSNTIYGLLEDKSGMIWMSTNGGICSFNPDTEVFRNYDLDDGLIALEYSQNAFFKGKDGTLYFGSNEGVTAFLPEDLVSNSIPPRVNLTGLKIANNSIQPGLNQPLERPISEAEKILLSHDQNEIALDYVGLHYGNSSRNQYSYQLVGFDQDWIDAGTKRSAIYTNLSPGEYTFKVKAANADGVWNEKGASIAITVLPPWYRTWWAYLLFAAILGFLVFLVDRIQRYRISQQEKERSALREAELRAEAENKRRADTEKLSRIGKTITSSLSIDTILDTVYENVNALMDAAVFSVGIHNPEKNALDFPAIKENGVTLDPYSNYLDEDHWLSVVCFLEKREIIIGDFLNEYSYYLKSKTKPLVGETPNSIIYLPLSQNGKVIGVITTQSFAKNAYSEYHVNILRNLANYAAIALDNASTYRKLSATQQQLVYSEKMASLGELTAGIAHEIQNPLNFVNNFSELNNELLDDLQDAISKNDQDEIDAIYADLRENESKINHHGKRAEEIVKSMLQHSRGGDGEKEPTDINALADEYLRLAYHGLRAKDKSFNAEFKADLDPKLAEVNIVPQDIGRVLLNLINNSFQAVSEKARANSNGYAPTVEVSTRKKHGNVEIVVKDNGPGIPQEIQDKIFQPFFTTKPTGEGTGLGLSMSFDIITKGHNGNIELQTKEGETKFIITLPTR